MTEPLTMEETIARAIRPMLRKAYLLGLRRGVAETGEKICAWLTQKPDTKRQAQIREWAEIACKSVLENHNDWVDRDLERRS